MTYQIYKVHTECARPTRSPQTLETDPCPCARETSHINAKLPTKLKRIGAAATTCACPQKKVNVDVYAKSPRINSNRGATTESTSSTTLTNNTMSDVSLCYSNQTIQLALYRNKTMLRAIAKHTPATHADFAHIIQKCTRTPPAPLHRAQKSLIHKHA